MQNENKDNATVPSGGGGSAATPAATTEARKVDPTKPPSVEVPHAYLNALLVGVESYISFAAHGGADLAGTVADVALWRSVLVRMGAAAIDKATAPTGGKSEATKDAIEGKFRDLLRGLAGAGVKQGVFVFSGHGMVDSSGERCLCPSDTDGTVNLITLNSLLESARTTMGDKASLTIVLDCCFSEVDEKAVRLSGLRLRSLPWPPIGVDDQRAKPKPLVVPPGVTLVGAGNDTFEHYGPGGWIGSFSFAATSALHRWTPYGETDDHDEPIGGTFFDVSYDRWLEATQQILTTLRLPSKPQVNSDSPDGAQLAVFQTPREDPKRTFPAPTSNRRPIQLDPGVDGLGFFDVKRGDTVIGTVVAVGPNPSTAFGWTPNSEYWDVDLATLGLGDFDLAPGTSHIKPDAPTHTGWRIDTSASVTDLSTGTLPAGHLFKLAGSALPTFKIDRSAAPPRTTWIRAAVQPVGASRWELRPAEFAYNQKYRTIDKHLDYGT